LQKLPAAAHSTAKALLQTAAHVLCRSFAAAVVIAAGPAIHHSPNSKSQQVSMMQHAAQQAKMPAQQAQQGPAAVPGCCAGCCDIIICPGA
jgi:hypothetical protein